MSRLKTLLDRPDKNFAEILLHGFWALMMLVGTTALQFVFDLILTNRFGAHGAGTFYLAFSVMMVLALIGRLGLDQAVVRFIPPFLKKQPGRAGGVVWSAVVLSLSITLPLVLGLYVASPWLANEIFHSPEIEPYLRVFAIAIPAFSLSYIFSGTLKAMKHTRTALSVERAGVYTFGIIALVTAGFAYGLDGLVVGFVLGIILTAIIGALHVRRYMPKFTKFSYFSKRTMLLTSIPLLFVAFATQMSGQASVLLLGAFGTNAEVGIFNVALKISMLMSLILAAINVIAATKVSELYSAKKQKDLSKMIQKISGLGTLLGVPLFLFIAIFSTQLLNLFGSEFTTGALALIILSAGQLFSVSVGSTNYILAMTGKQKALAIAVCAALLANILLGLWLIPTYGIIGAAISTGASIVISNLFTVLLVKKYLRVWSLPFSSLMTWVQGK